MITKQCKNCGQHRPETDYYRHPMGYLFAQCKPCCIAARRARYLRNPEVDQADARARLLKDPRVRMAAAARKRDRIKGLQSDIRANDITIPKACPVLGIPLAAGVGKSGPGSPSVDHIDPTRGAVWGNWRVISNRANLLKKDHTAQTLAEYIEKVESGGRYPDGRPVVLRGAATVEEYRKVLAYLGEVRA